MSESSGCFYDKAMWRIRSKIKAQNIRSGGLRSGGEVDSDADDKSCQEFGTRFK
jgi:hypothetical protein